MPQRLQVEAKGKEEKRKQDDRMKAEGKKIRKENEK
jgi:hypothetical protein